MSEHPFTQIGSAEPNIPDDPFVDPSYEPADFVVVANRLPLRHAGTPGDDGWLPSPGGLVSALTSVLQSRKGLWIGWPGTSEDQEPPSTYEGIRLKTVAISAEEYEEFYLGFSNATIWPLYHDAIRSPSFHRTWWHTYREVNMRFATTVAENVAPGGTVWVHDYQLQLVPQMLRELRPDVHIGFFFTSRSPRANCSCNCRGDVRSWPDSSAPISWDSSCTPRPPISHAWPVD